MKSIKYVALSAFLTLSAFCAVLYTSCSKDKCKDVTCLNGGTCSDGNCTCKVGTSGTNCDVVYRTLFSFTYKGNGTDNIGGTYTNNTLTFTSPSDTSDYTQMQMVWKDGVGGVVYTLPVTLSNFATSGAIITIPSTTQSGYTVSGTGTISATAVSLSLTETPVGGGTAVIYTFTNFLKQ